MADRASKSRSVRRWLGRGLLALAVLASLAVALFYALTVWPDRRSEPYREAVERLRQNHSASFLLGRPVETGWWVRGHAGADSARLAVPVSGARRAGVLHVEAHKAGSAWQFSRIELAVRDNTLSVNLLENTRQREQRQDDRIIPLPEPPPRAPDDSP